MLPHRLTYTDKDYQYILEETYKLSWSKHPIVELFRFSHKNYDKVLKSYHTIDYQEGIKLPFVFGRDFTPTTISEVGGDIPVSEDLSGFFYWSVLKKAGFSFDLDSYRTGLTTDVVPVNTLISYQGIFYRVIESYPVNWIGEDFFLGIAVRLELLQRGSVQFKSDAQVITSVDYGFLASLPTTYDSDTLTQLKRSLRSSNHLKAPFEIEESYRFVSGYFACYVDLEKIQFSQVSIKFDNVSATLSTIDLGYIGDTHLGLLHSSVPFTLLDTLTVSITVS